MKKRLIAALSLVAYGALLIKVMVFKDIPTIKLGQLMLNFAGTDAGNAPNFVPFATILPYLLGHKGLIIAGINLVGNVVLLIPVGFLIPFVYRSMTWKKCLTVAVSVPLVIETMQTMLRVGIFDIDDVILNAFGVMIGYWTFLILSKWMEKRQYINIFIAAVAVVAVIAAVFYFVYPWGQPVNPGASINDVHFDRSNNEESEIPESGDRCGGTGGVGKIVSLGNNEFIIMRNDGSQQTVHLADQVEIQTSAGVGSVSDLKVGDRVTLVGGPNPDRSFTADAVVICSA